MSKIQSQQLLLFSDSKPAPLKPARVFGLPFAIWTDGSCPKNDGQNPGGWAAIVVRDSKVVAELYGAKAPTTNNQMELMGILEGLKHTPDGSICTVYSDSQYAIACVTEWWVKWERRGWKLRKGGSQVKNRELIEAIVAETQKRRVAFKWVKGHAGTHYNEMADKLSMKAAASYDRR